jgi:hypothetical protein
MKFVSLLFLDAMVLAFVGLALGFTAGESKVRAAAQKGRLKTARGRGRARSFLWGKSPRYKLR